MAKLLLAVNSNTSDATRSQDGDIVCAFNDKRIKYTHAQVICRGRTIPFNTDGLRVPDSLADKLFEKTSQYKFERINATTIRKILLSDTSITEDISDTPNRNGERINVARFIRDATLGNRHWIFGTTGSEYWYGGKTTVLDANLNDVWTEIEKSTSFREVDHREWPLTSREKKVFFAIKTDDFDDATANLYTTPQLDDQGNVVKKRTRKVDYPNITGIDATKLAEIRNKNLEIDERKTRTYTRSSVVGVKQ